MTKEEAIKSALKYLVHKQQEQGSWGYSDRNENEISWNKVLKWLDQQPCGDLISRQAVIDTIETDCSWDIFNEWGSRTPTGECIINAIKSVPSVETESCGDCISRQAVLDLAESGKLVSNGNYKSVCDAINGLPSVEPEKCGDCISREAAIYAVGYYSVHSDDKLLFADKPLKDLPSVEPERKTGKWVHMVGWWECDQCNAEYTEMPTCMGKVIYEYCPMCGAKMEVGG